MARPRLLVVDDSRMFVQVLVERMKAALDVEVVTAGTLGATRAVVEADQAFHVALLDLNLPDAPNGEVVDVVLAHTIPVIVFAGDCSEETRTRLWTKGIVDYIIKEGEESLHYAVRLVRRIIHNRSIAVLVVDDSATVRHMLAEMLAVHCLTVFQADNGRQGLQVLTEHPEVQLVITDYEMPEMDGIRFVHAVRGIASKEELAIIGISGHDQKNLSARFLKSGANDFLHKPFSAEELYCRIIQNLDLLEYIHTIRDLSQKDPLTGVANRRYFFEQAEKVMRKAQTTGLPVYVAMLDLDHFKRINDHYGHAVGDAVLRHVGTLLEHHFAKAGVVGRLGGEEFAVLVGGGRDIVEQMERFRQELAAQPVVTPQGEVSVTASIGVCQLPGQTLERHLVCADQLLYRAKNRGRNRVELGMAPQA